MLINKNHLNVFIGIYNNSINVSRSQCKVIKINWFFWTRSAFSNVHSLLWLIATPTLSKKVLHLFSIIGIQNDWASQITCWSIIRTSKGLIIEQNSSSQCQQDQAYDPSSRGGLGYTLIFQNQLVTIWRHLFCHIQLQQTKRSFLRNTFSLPSCFRL